MPKSTFPVVDVRLNSEFGYSDFDRERYLPEPRESASRGEFARDRARVVHSAALRRLGAKTQVLSPTNGGDFARTRLTHSLEVAQIGREMAIDLELNPDIVDMACLAHDLGHPPFGHNGETALNDWASDIGGFEGNAQTLRLLVRIEPKVFTPSGRSLGLNLTRASLDATCKYPWARGESDSETAEGSQKFGYYEDDKEIFDWFRQGAPAGQKSMEAQVMDFADDVAYSVHDFEDAIVGGFLDVGLLLPGLARAELLEKVAEWSSNKFSTDELTSAFNRLENSEFWITSFDRTAQSLAQLKNLTSALIGRFVRAAVSSLKDLSAEASLARFGGALMPPREIAAEIALLKGLVSAVLMTAPHRQSYYDWQRDLLQELAEALYSARGLHLDSYCSSAWLSATSADQRKRVIVDQIASLTDQSAITLHSRLVDRKA